MTQPLDQANATLMQALKFSAEDLAANRKGTLTAAQQERVRTVVAQGRTTILAVGGIVILIVVGVIVYMLLGSQGILPLPDEFDPSSALLVSGVMGGVLVVYVIILAAGMSRSKNMGTGRAAVRSLTGKVKIKTQGMTPYSAAAVVSEAAGAPTRSYIVQVGKEKIYSTDAAVQYAFQDGGTYRVYVIGKKPGYMLVSAEAMAG